MKKFSLLVYVVLFTIEIYAQNFWQQTNGPYCVDSTICEVRILTLTSNKNILATTVDGGLHTTTNDGQSWEKTNYYGDEINSIVSINDSIIITGDYNKLYVSYNLGISWVTINGFVNDLFYDSTNNLIHWANERKIFTSNNFGQNWILLKEFSGPWYVIVMKLYVTNENHFIFSNVYFADHFGNWVTLYRSTNQGLSWGYGGISRLIYDIEENDLGTLYVLTNNLLFISYDEGDNWISKNTVGLCLSSDIFETLYLGTSNGIFYSFDQGTNWIRMDESGLLDTRINDVLIKDNKIFVATRKGVHVSNAIVPVELISFTVSYSVNSIFLNWTTASEINNYGFEIERSGDKTNWRLIGLKAGYGTTTESKNYTFIDDLFGENSLKLYYRLKQVDYDGSFEYSDIVEVDIAPSSFSLSQNYPNPFNPTTNIEFRIAEFGFVSLKVFDLLGREVATLVNEEKQPGVYEVDFDASNVSSGIYYYQLKAGDFIETKKMVYLK